MAKRAGLKASAKTAPAEKVELIPASYEQIEIPASEVVVVKEVKPTHDAPQVKEMIYPSSGEREEANYAIRQREKAEEAERAEVVVMTEADLQSDMVDAALEFYGLERSDLKRDSENGGVRYLGHSVRLFIQILDSDGKRIDTAILLYRPSMEANYKAPKHERTLSAKEAIAT